MTSTNLGAHGYWLLSLHLPWNLRVLWDCASLSIGPISTSAEIPYYLKYSLSCPHKHSNITWQTLINYINYVKFYRLLQATHCAAGYSFHSAHIKCHVTSVSDGRLKEKLICPTFTRECLITSAKCITHRLKFIDVFQSLRHGIYAFSNGLDVTLRFRGPELANTMFRCFSFASVQKFFFVFDALTWLEIQRFGRKGISTHECNLFKFRSEKDTSLAKNAASDLDRAI